MRSHPYTPPPPLPPILDELADEISSILPNQGAPRRASDGEIEMSELNPDTSRLLPVKRKRHTVRVQGKLVVVRSVSTVNLRNGPAGPRYESAVGSVVSPRRPRRRRSFDETGRGGETDSESEAEERERVTVRDRQLRGYGIGGAGNIRRPTEVVHFPSRRSDSVMLFSPTSPTSPTSGAESDKRRWNIREFLGLTGDRKGKAKVNP